MSRLRNLKESGHSTKNIYQYVFMLNALFLLLSFSPESKAQCTKPNAGKDVAICLPKTTIDLVDALSGQTWSTDPANAFPSSINATTGAVTGMTAIGTYQFILAISPTCRDTVKISVSDSTKYKLCNGESYDLYVQPGVTNVQWQVFQGTGYVDIPGATGLVYEATQVGIYRYIGKDETGCDAELCCPVTIIPGDCCIKPSAGADLAMCFPKSIADFPDASATQTWTVGTGNPVTPVINATTGSVTGMTAVGTYMFILKENSSTVPCADTVLVVVSPQPTPTVNSPTICEGGSATLTIAACAGTVHWLDGPITMTRTVSPIVTTTYSFTCIVAGCESAQVDALVTVVPKPKAGPDVSICVPVATVDFADAAAGQTWAAAAGNPTGGGTIAATTGVVSGMTGTGVFKFVLSSSLTGCTDTVMVTRVTQPVPTVNNPTICSGSSATLTVANCVGGIVTWNNGSTESIRVVAPNVTTSYKFVCAMGGCVSDSVTATVTVTPKPYAGPDESICAPVATVDLVDAAAGQTWSAVAGNPAGGSINATTGVVSGMTAIGTYKYVLSSTLAGCSDTVNVVRKAQPVPTVNSPTICEGSSATLTVSGCVAGTVRWFDASPVIERVVSPTATKTYTFTCTIDGCESDVVTATVTVIPKPIAGADVVICAPVATVDLVDAAAGQTWSVVAGNPAAATIAATTGVVSGMTANGKYKFVLSSTLSGCTDTVMVTRNPQPKPTVNSPSICIGSEATLTVEKCLGTVSWADGSTSFIRTVSPTATTTYKFACTENGCVSDSVTATVTVLAKPVLTIITPKVICDGSSVQLTVSSDKPAATYLWNGSAISNLTIANPIVAPAGSLQEDKVYIYTVTLVDSDGCKADASTTVTVTPSLRVNAGVDQTICENSTTALKAVGNLTTSATNGTVTITWSEAATNPNSGSNLATTTGANVTTNALLAGEYQFTATITQKSPDGKTDCVNTDVMKVTVVKQPVITIVSKNEKGATSAICNDNTDAVTLAATLSATTPGAATIQWSSVQDPTLAFLSCTTCDNPVLTVPNTYTGATITYTAKAIVTGDNNIECSSQQSITITINKAPVLIVTTPKIICDGTTVQLNVTSSTTALSYLWSGGPLNNNAIANPIVSPTGSLQENTEYVYSVLVKDINGCSSIGTTKVTVTPSITVYAGSDQTLCETSVATLTATTNLMTSATNGTITVTWSEAASNPSSGSNLAATTGYSVQTKALAPGEYLFNATVTQVSPDGVTNCVNTDQIKVTIVKAPVVSIVPTAMDICAKAQETIILNATLSTAAAATFTWSSTDDPTLAFLSCKTCSNPALTVPASYTGSTISYKVKAVVTSDNNQECFDDADVTITINPVLSVTPITNVTVCNEYIPVKQSRTATLKDAAGNNVNIASYEITPMVGITNIVVSGANITFDVTPSASQIEYTVKLTSAQTCWASTKFWGYQNARPVVDFTMDSYVCLGSKVQVMFNGNAAPGATYTWNFAGATVLYSNDATPYDGIASGPGPHDIQWNTYPGFGNTYRVQLTVNDGGCSATTFKDIRIERGYTVTWNKENTSACSANDGKITMASALEKVTNRDVSSTLVFTWSGPNGYAYTAAYPAGANLTGLAPGTYHVRVDNSIGGCAYETDINILRPENIGLNALVAYKATCGKKDGGLHVEAVGGTAPYTFTYYDASGAQVAVHAAVADSVDYLWNLVEGKYKVVIEDSKKCSTSGEIIIDNADGPKVEIVSLVPTACGESKGEVEFTIFGSAPFSYKLYSSNPYPGGTISQSGIPVKLEFVAADDYVLEVTDSKGCKTIKKFKIVSQGSNFNIDVQVTPGSCAYNPNGSTNPQTGALKVLSPLGATYTYTWKKADGTTLTTTTPTNPTGLATGIYKLIVSNGTCKDSTTVVINPAEGPKPEIVATTNPSCPDATDGSVTIVVNKNPATGQPDKNLYDLTNIGPFFYTLKNTTSQNGLVLSGQIEEAKNLTLSGLEQGTYLVTITDRNSCVGYQTFTITDNPAFEIHVDRQNLVVCDANDGKVCFSVVGANGGTYTVTVNPDEIVASPFTAGQVSCIFGMSANVDYNVTVKDTKGCVATFPVKLTQPDVCFDCDKFCVNDLEAYDMTCDSTSSGKARVTVTGGKAPFTYTWYNSFGTVVKETVSSDSTNMISGLPVGTYYVKVVDANKCAKGGYKGDKSVNVGQTGGPVVTITSTTPAACGGSTGQIRFSVTGKTNFTYSLTAEGSSTALATGSITNIPNAITLSSLVAQTYVLKVTDGNGCSTITVIDITSKEFPMNLVTTVTKPTCDGTTLGTIDLSLTPKAGQTAPTGTPTVTWTGPSGAFVPANPMKAEFLQPGTYTVNVAYSNGCSDSKEVVVSPSDAPTVTATPQATIKCVGASNASFVLNANGNGQAIIGYIVKGVKSVGYTAPYPTTITGEVVNGLAPGSYEIEVVGVNGCIGTTSIDIAKPTELNILVDAKPVDDCDINNGTLTISMVSGGLAPYKIKFKDSTTTYNAPKTWTGLAAGNYTIEVEDANGCKAAFPATVISIRDQICYGSIGDYVWKDKDNDGIQDATEVGVNNVKVILWKASATGTPLVKLDSMMTSGGGKYLFDTLKKGDYLVQVVSSSLPAGCYLSDSTNKGTNDAVDTDFDPTTGLSQLVKLDPIKGGLDKNNPTIDAALFTPYGSIGDYVWKDEDNDGLQDPTEAGVKDVKVVLWSATATGSPIAKLDSMLTTATGMYKFDSLLKGNYVVQIVPTSFPDGCSISQKNDIGTNDLLDNDFNPTTGISPVVVLDPVKGGIQQNNPTIDGALFTPLGSIGDFVWKDKNDDGSQSTGEVGVDAVKVILWSASATGTPLAKLDSMMTHDGGKYLFDSLKKGDYIVQFVTSTLPDGCSLSQKPNTGDDTKDSDANATTGLSPVVKLDPIKGGLDQNNPTIDAGLFTPLGSIGDFVWKDKNDDGTQSTGEVGVDAVKVILWSASSTGSPLAKLDSAMTSGGGKYLFDSLKKGNYVVQFVTSTLPAGCYLSKKPDTGDDTKDSDANPTTGFSSLVKLDPIKGGLDQNNPTVDAGLVTVLGSIGDYVWKDEDNDGIQDATEAGVNGVKVNLWSADVSGNPVTKLDSTVTAGGGKYLFSNLPAGRYIVQIDKLSFPVGCELSEQENKGTDDTKDSDFRSTTGLSPVVTLDPIKGGLDQNNLTIDAGLKSTLGSIGDYVWKDTNNDGIQTTGESGVNGVKVILWTADQSGNKVTKLDSMLTANGGIYLFDNLPAGRYIVQIVKSSLPDGCSLSSQQNKGGDDAKDDDFDPDNGLSPVVTLDPSKGGIDKDNLTIDAALVSPKGSIGDYVWKDADNDGVQDADEAGVNGVKVILWTADASGNKVTPIDTVLTANGGAYTFTNLPAGRYIVQIDKTTFPAGCELSDQTNKGGDDAKDSDFDPTSGLSPVVILDPTKGGIDKDNPTVDAALKSTLGSIGDYVWKDTNNDGIQDASEAGVDGIKVTLWSADVSGNPLAVLKGTTTAAGGKYLFTDLPAGRYIVEIDDATLPVGCALSSQTNKGGDDAKDSDFDPTSGLSPVVTLTPSKGGIDKDNLTIDGALYSPKGSLGDYVWKDVNNNGIQDASEAGVAGVIIELFKNGVSTGITATTDANGKYLFSNLDAGTYKIKVIASSIPADCAISTQKDQGGDDAKDSDVDPTTGESGSYVINPADPTKKDITTVDAALRSVLGSIGDYVWKDTNNDGIQDATEIGVDGVKVQLWSADASGNPVVVLKNTTTAAGGKYLFSDLPAGRYIVKIDAITLPVGCALSTQSNKGTDDAKDSDFDPTSGLSPVVTLDPAKGGLDKNNPTIDGALYSPKGSLGDYVWKDTNNDGIQNIGEAGVAGIVIELFKDGVTTGLTATTDANGKYLFSNLDAGTYKIKIRTSSIPADCALSLQKDKGTDDAKDSDVDPTTGESGNYVINPADPTKRDITTVDAALYSALGSIGDYVWKDTNNDGIQTTGEAGVNGVIVQLWSADVSGNPVTKLKEMATANGGAYSFTGLAAGRYIVKVDAATLPAGCALSQQVNKGTDDTKDNDFNPVSGLSPVITLDPSKGGLDKDNPTIDAALIPTGKAVIHVTKTVNNSTVHIGDVVTYTIKVWNDGTKDTTGVQVQEALYAGAQYVSSTATNGSYNPTTKLWTINSLIAKGDTAKLTVKVKVISGGTWFNSAIIKDPNGNPDDSSTVCISAIIPICTERGESVELTATETYPSYQWYNNNQAITGATGKTYIAKAAGSYTVKQGGIAATSCPNNVCCPIIVVDVCECVKEICVPLLIRKTK